MRRLATRQGASAFAPAAAAQPARVLRSLGAVVTEQIYPGMGHGINDDEIKRVRTLLAKLSATVA
jgi:predicted esterase